MDAVTAPIQYCSQCGQPWPTDELARFGDQFICANCKNTYAQRLREGAGPAAGVMAYAGFWIRALALLIDGVILFVAGMVVQMPFTALLTSRRFDLALLAQGIVGLIQLAIAATYEGLFVARYQATPGKMALNLKVIRSNGAPLTMGRAFGRYFAKFLNTFTLGIGYIMAGFDAQKRGLHDMICDTRVIKTGN